MRKVNVTSPPADVRQNAHDEIHGMISTMLRFAGKSGIDKWNALQDIMRQAPEAGHDMISRLIGIRRDQIRMPPPGPSARFNRESNAILKDAFAEWQTAILLAGMNAEGSA